MTIDSSPTWDPIECNDEEQPLFNEFIKKEQEEWEDYLSTFFDSNE